MSTAPQAVVVPPNIAEAQVLLAKRLLPAKLDGSRKENGHVFNAWLIRQGKAGLILSMTGAQIAETLYQAIQADVQSEHPQLAWTVPPRALTRHMEQAKPTAVGDTRELSDFESKVRASEKSDAERKAQEQAKKRCQELVERFAPINHRRGTLNFDLRDTKQAAWRKRIAEAKDFVALEKEIATEQRKLYEAAERAAERI